MVDHVQRAVHLQGEIPREREGSQITQEGVFEGKKILFQQDATSLIADAAEELTFEASEIVEKKIEERRVEKERPSELIQRIRKLQQMVPDFNEKTFLRLLETLKKQLPSSSRELRDATRSAFSEVSHQHLALKLLEEAFQDVPELQSLAKVTREELEAEAGPAIRAGINTSSIANRYAQQGLGELSELRDFYRTTILHYEGVTETFRAITERFPDQAIPDAVGYLLRAVGHDLHAKGPSLEPEELRMILNDLYYLEYLAHLHHSCDQLLRRTERGFGVPLSLNSKGLVAEFLTLTDKTWITSSDVLNLAHKAGLVNTSARIYFLQGFLDMARQAPLKLFANDEKRLALVAKVQEALDQSIAEES